MGQFWLVKSEPNVYSIEDLRRDGRTHWNGVRNYQARNIMRDQMEVGDLVLFYHSNADPPSVAGLARVVREGYPDVDAWDPESPYFDEKSDPSAPRWFMVDIEFLQQFDHPVSLDSIRQEPKLKDMVLVNRSRLSVQPVQPREFEIIVQMARGK